MHNSKDSLSTIVVSIAIALIAVATPIYAAEYEFRTQSKLVAIGDINGGYNELVSILEEVDVINANLDWIGGDTQLITLGNYLDVSGKGSQVPELLMSLEKQAELSGGKVHALLGDTDVDLLVKSDVLTDQTRIWLRQRPVIIKINKVVYTHGGISDGLVTESLISLNKAAQQDLNKPAEAHHEAEADYSIFAARSPIRYEGTAICHPYSESFNTERFLKNIGATQMVVGHVSANDKVTSRMGGLVVLLDTGMSQGGTPAVLVSEQDESYVHYLGSHDKAPVVAEWNLLSQRISGLGDAEVEVLLTGSPIASVTEIGTGITNPWRIELLKDGVEHSAVFKYVDTAPGIQSKKYYNTRRGNDSDRYVYEVAAYKLDRMLDIQLIPVAVVATVNGKEGVLQDWITNAINERDRLEGDVLFDGPCRQLEQYRLRIVFDILIFNEDRNLTNIVWAKENFKMRFIDHTRAFRSSKQRPEQYSKVSIRVSELLKGKLESLTMVSLTKELGPYLHPMQIESLLARRDLILKKMKSTGF